MRIKGAGGSLLVLMLSIAAGAAAFGLAWAYLQQQEQELREEYRASQSEETALVVVATRNVRPGDVATGDNFRGQRIPARHVPATAVSVDQFRQSVGGRVINEPMRPGEPLVESFVSGLASHRFSDLLEEGERAVTVRVDEINSNAGLLEMGDYVDVYVRAQPPEGRGGGATDDEGAQALVPVRERVKVLAVGRESLRTRDQEFISRSRRPTGRGGQQGPASGQERRYATVTMAVSRDDAAKIALGRELGDFVFMLRHTEDDRLRGDELLAQDMLWETLRGEARAGAFRVLSPDAANGAIMQPQSRPVSSLGGSTGQGLIKSRPLTEQDGE